jgi:hypothetical protein
MTTNEVKATSPANEDEILVAGNDVTEPNNETEGMIVDVETHAPHVHKTGHNWVDLVVAISALFVSVVSLGIGILHGRTMERMAEETRALSPPIPGRLCPTVQEPALPTVSRRSICRCSTAASVRPKSNLPN